MRWKGLVKKVSAFEGRCKGSSEIDVSDAASSGRHGHGKVVVSVLGFRRKKGSDADICEVS
jgi:hypothetical protein